MKKIAFGESMRGLSRMPGALNPSKIFVMFTGIFIIFSTFLIPSLQT
jgi:hypothetical protein